MKTSLPSCIENNYNFKRTSSQFDISPVKQHRIEDSCITNIFDDYANYAKSASSINLITSPPSSIQNIQPEVYKNGN